MFRTLSVVASLALTSALVGCAADVDTGTSGSQAIHACPPGDPTCVPGSFSCEVAAKELTARLAALRACKVAGLEAAKACAVTVPTIDGCDQPIAFADTAETKKYLELFGTYAEHCPLPLRPCPAPPVRYSACVQGPDVDGLVGRCEFVEGPKSSTTTAAD